MHLRITLFLLLCLLQLRTMAQDKIEVTWSSVFETDIIDRFETNYLGSDDQGAFVVFHNMQPGSFRVDQTVQFCKIDAKGEITLQKDLVVMYDKRQAVYMNTFNLKGNIYLFTSYWDKPSRTKYIWANKIDHEGNMDLKSIQLASYTAAPDNDPPDVVLSISDDSSSLILREYLTFKIFDHHLSE
ncbi:MAG: hypothetical protein JWO58_166 [Chitinophagaceae bacterium]|nr:hypothetical protein [Chitinophagaceae bacterium]